MKHERYLKITVKTAIAVYLPKDDVADEATADGALLTKLKDAANWRRDGRRRYSVEQIHAGAEKLIENAIRDLVYDHVNAKFHRSISAAEAAGGSANEFMHEVLIEKRALAMMRVVIRDTEMSDEHTLEFEVEGDP